MKTALIYTSKYGTTDQVAQYIQSKINCDIYNLLVVKPPDIEHYDRVIIGGSIYYGNIHKKLSNFIDNALPDLVTKKISLFLVCLLGEDSAAEQFNNNFPTELLNLSDVEGLFGGLLDRSKLNLLERFITRIAYHKNDELAIDYSEIDKFIDCL